MKTYIRQDRATKVYRRLETFEPCVKHAPRFSTVTKAELEAKAKEERKAKLAKKLKSEAKLTSDDLERLFGIPT